MLKLFKISSEQYKVVSNAAQVDCEGTLEEAKEVMRALGTEDDAINEALLSMETHGHNTADFGLNISTGGIGFIFSANCTVKYVTRREAVFTQLPKESETTKAA